MYYYKSKPKTNQCMHLPNTDAQLYTKPLNYLSIKCKLSLWSGKQAGKQQIFNSSSSPNPIPEFHLQKHICLESPSIRIPKELPTKQHMTIIFS